MRKGRGKTREVRMDCECNKLVLNCFDRGDGIEGEREREDFNLIRGSVTLTDYETVFHSDVQHSGRYFNNKQ